MMLAMNRFDKQTSPSYFLFFIPLLWIGWGQAQTIDNSAWEKLATYNSLNGGIQGHLLGGNGSPTVGTIYAFDLVSATAQPIFEGGEPNRAFNGEWVYVNRDTDVVLVGLDNTIVTTFDTNWDFYALNRLYPALSPDGGMIAYLDANPDYYTKPNQPSVGVMVKARAGNTLAFFPGMTQPAWTPDGRLVMVGSQIEADTEGAYGLFIVGASGTPVQLGQSLSNPQMPSVSPDGSTILFVQGDGSVWAIGTDGSHQHKLNDSSSIRFLWPTFSPDGVYMSAVFEYAKEWGSGAECAVGITRTDGTMPQPVTVSDVNGSIIIPCNRVVWR
jgi:Tol biopolymer transport system component